MKKNADALEKCPTGIAGLDAIAGGGLPRGRPTLVCGGPGCGKSLLALEFVVRGARDLGEPGVFVSFEESIAELDRNVASLGFDLAGMREAGLLAMDHVIVSAAEIEQAGEFDLDGLFVRLGHAIDTVGARRVALDTIETLFASLRDTATLRSELVRLFRWLKDRGVTAVVTGEQGDGGLTRYGLEEYVSDCVIFLDHRVKNHVSTRHLRFVKYRGSVHGTNEYPFSIGASGLRVLPVTAIELDHPAQAERVTTGVARLDEMLDGGLHRGSSVLLSGTAGTGKSTVALTFATAACAAGERALVFSFEESPAQIERNLVDVGIDVARWTKEGLLRIVALRPQFLGLEQHLLAIQEHVEEHRPSAVVVDPLNALLRGGDEQDTRLAILRLVDFLKRERITALYTTLTEDERLEHTNVAISSLMDTWILLRDIELGGERNRGIYVLKSRGTRHSNQIREFSIGPNGIDLVDVYNGPEGVLTGAARMAQEAADREARAQRALELERLEKRLAHEATVFEARVAELRGEFERRRDDLLFEIENSRARVKRHADDAHDLVRYRSTGGGS